MRVLLAAGALVAAVVVTNKRRRQRISSDDACGRHGAKASKGTQQLVHAYPTAAPAAAASPSGAAAGSSSSSITGGSGTSSSLSARLASVVLLPLLAALAAGTVALLVARGQPDLAAAVALTWLLAVPAMLSLGRQSAAAPAAASAEEAAPDAVVVVDDVAQQPTQALLDAFHGTWLKDAAASESMDAAMRLVRLNPVMRQAVKLIRGVQLRPEEDGFRFAVFSAISWFKITETFPWGGEVHENRRRDMRRGRSRGRVEVSAKGTLLVHYQWDAPHAGVGRDEFSLDEQGRLRLATVVHVGGQSASYVQVYRRRARGHHSSSGGGGGGAAAQQGRGVRLQEEPSAPL